MLQIFTMLFQPLENEEDRQIVEGKQVRKKLQLLPFLNSSILHIKNVIWMNNHGLKISPNLFSISFPKKKIKKFKNEFNFQ